MSFLLNIPEEIAEKVTAGAGEAFTFIGDKLAEVGAALEALSARIDALEHHGDAPAAAPPSP